MHTIGVDRGWLYLSEQRYRDILKRAFGADSWRLSPLSELHSTPSGKTLYRTYALYVDDRFISEAMGDHSHNEEKVEYAALVSVLYF